MPNPGSWQDLRSASAENDLAVGYSQTEVRGFLSKSPAGTWRAGLAGRSQRRGVVVLRPSLKFRARLMERGLTVSEWTRARGYNLNTVWSVLGRLDSGRRFKDDSLSKRIAEEIIREMEDGR
jgi:hypothetical protein